MENLKTNNQASLFTSIKAKAKNAGIIIGIVVFMMVLAGGLFNNLSAKETYIPKVPVIQASYEFKREEIKKHLQAYCEEWKSLSKAKIEDNINGVLEENRVTEWRKNLDFKCSEVEAPVGF